MGVFHHLIVFLTSQIEFEFSFTRYNLKIFRFLLVFLLGAFFGWITITTIHIEQRLKSD